MKTTHDKNSIDISPLIHQAILYPHADLETITRTCDMSRHLGFSGLCSNLNHLPIARKRLGTPNSTKLIAAIAFPFGYIPTSIKLQEAEWAAAQGAEELDVVPNFFALSQGKEELFAEELSEICELGLPVRAIIDITNLSSSKVALAIEAALEAGVHGIQNCNGFGGPANSLQIKRLKELVKNKCQIKAIGGIKTLDHALDLIQAGATHIGTTAGEQLINELKNKQK